MSRKLVQDDKELLQISQVELKKLQRQYRIMEGDKNSYASEIKCYLNKQRFIILRIPSTFCISTFPLIRISHYLQENHRHVG